jgi:hypothetical protein
MGQSEIAVRLGTSPFHFAVYLRQDHRCWIMPETASSLRPEVLRDLERGTHLSVWIECEVAGLT